MKPFKARERAYRKRASLRKKIFYGFMIISLSWLVLNTFTACEKTEKEYNYHNKETKELE